MMSRHEFLGFTAALAATGVAAPQRKAPSVAELEAEALRSTPHKAAKIMAMDEPGIIAILKDGKALEFDKAKACQRLAVVGTGKSVPALAALLNDAKLSHYARYALEPMPGPEAGEALRVALGRLEGSLLIGVINSLGRRKDAEAIPALAKLRHTSNRAVADAADAALADIRRP